MRDVDPWCDPKHMPNRLTGREYRCEASEFCAGRGESFMSDLATLAESVAVDPLVGHPADFHVFHQFLERCKYLPAITTSVCWPLSDVALRGTVEAAEEGIIKPTLVGPSKELH